MESAPGLWTVGRGDLESERAYAAFFGEFLEGLGVPLPPGLPQETSTEAPLRLQLELESINRTGLGTTAKASNGTTQDGSSHATACACPPCY